MKRQIEKAVRVLNKGGIIIFPTDTAFGIGCRMDSESAVARLFSIRKKPQGQSVSVLVDSLEMAQKYLKPLDKKVKTLMEKYWPGALTIVYKCRTDKVAPLIRRDGETLGVRMPDHETILGLIKGVGVPILGPSANFHGERTPYELEDLDPELIKLVDYVFPGETKNIGSASTVIDVSTSPWKIIRKGAIKID